VLGKAGNQPRRRLLELEWPDVVARVSVCGPCTAGPASAPPAKGDSPDQEIDEAPTFNKDDVLVDRCSPDQSQLQQTVKIVKELQESERLNLFTKFF
jgi:hypothetical protein